MMTFAGIVIISKKVTEIVFKEFCQNPNLTPTQPQLNLNLVGFDTIITLHHPPHPTPHRNSTSTRNNDPRGLKFCKRPYQAKLTTIQHNFNPTFFWGGGSYILHLGLTLPVFLDKKKSDPNLLTNFFFAQKIFTQNFLTQNFSDLKNF